MEMAMASLPNTHAERVSIFNLTSYRAFMVFYFIMVASVGYNYFINSHFCLKCFIKYH